MLKLLLLTLLLQVNDTDKLTTLLEQAQPSQPKTVRMEALWKLRVVGKKDPERLLKALEPYTTEKDPEIRARSLLAIGITGNYQTNCPLCFIRALKDDDQEARGMATAFILAYNKCPREAIPLLLGAVESDDPSVRQAVSSALRKSGQDTPEIHQAFETLISDPDTDVRDSAYLGYYQLTGDINRYVTHLLKLTSNFVIPSDAATTSDDERERAKTLAELREVKLYQLACEKDEELSRTLIHHLQHDDPRIRRTALYHLQMMCDHSQSSFRAVAAQKPQKKLKSMTEADEDNDIRRSASTLLQRLETGPPKDAPEKLVQIDLNSRHVKLPVLLEQAQPSQPKIVRLEALRKLKEAGKKDPARVVKSLELLLQEKDAGIRSRTVLAIVSSGLDQIPYPLCALKLLADEDETVRHEVAGYLSIYETFPEEAGPLLFAALDSQDATVRSAISTALPRVVGDTPRVRKTLEKLFSDPEIQVRHNAHVAHYHLTGDMNRYVYYLLSLIGHGGDASESASNTEQDRPDIRKTFSQFGSYIIYNLTREKPDDLAKALIHHLNHKDPGIRRYAAQMLRAMCVTSKASFRAVAARKPQQKLKDLRDNDDNEWVRTWAGVVIERLEAGPPKDAPEKLELPDLKDFQESEDRP